MPSDFCQCQWPGIYFVPGRELLECLVLVAGEELRGSTEGAGAGGQSDRGLHPGADQWSTNEAGRADGARRDTEDRKRRHVGSEGLTGSKGGEGIVDGTGKGGRSHTRLDFAGGVVFAPEAATS